MTTIKFLRHHKYFQHIFNLVSKLYLNFYFLLTHRVSPYNFFKRNQLGAQFRRYYL
jgi:hypothetical protein